MRDFSMSTYSYILETLSKYQYTFQTYEDFCISPNEKVIVLRHDVDRAPYNGLKMAKIEKSLDIKASYYFRVVSESYDEKIIEAIIDLGHELGYHYEDLAMTKGNFESAIERFEKNLEMFRKFYPVRTMCMHGSPMSDWDNKLLWESNSYKKYGIIGEPYFDIDFNKVYYITDASRTWNNEQVTIRDKVKSKLSFIINSSEDIIDLITRKQLPDKVMLSTHPHNWADSFPEWVKILYWQGIKNQVKKVIVKRI